MVQGMLVVSNSIAAAKSTRWRLATRGCLLPFSMGIELLTVDGDRDTLVQVLLIIRNEGAPPAVHSDVVPLLLVVAAGQEHVYDENHDRPHSMPSNQSGGCFLVERNADLIATLRDDTTGQLQPVLRHLKNERLCLADLAYQF